MDEAVFHALPDLIGLSLLSGLLVALGVLAVVSLYWGLRRAEVGYEDESGFHRGPPPEPKLRKVRGAGQTKRRGPRNPPSPPAAECCPPDPERYR